MSSSHSSSKKELRASLILPIVISIGILLIGVLFFQFVPPSQFNNALILLVGGGMLAFLIYWTRHANWQLRLVALLLALPALAGITLSMIRGSSWYIVIGIGATFVLLVIQRAFTIPTSYRVASRAFHQGDYERALQMINKTIQARPQFAESYQLRAMIRMIYKQFVQAEEDAKQAIAKQPAVHTHYNTLGQIYLAESRYNKALETFDKAVALDDSVAMNHYHKGLCAYRLGDHQLAAEALSMSTKKTLPLIEYDLLAHFYLYQSLLARTEMKETAVLQETLSTMKKFANGLPQLKAMANQQADFEYILLLRQDITKIEQLLSQ